MGVWGDAGNVGRLKIHLKAYAITRGEDDSLALAAGFELAPQKL